MDPDPEPPDPPTIIIRFSTASLPDLPLALPPPPPSQHAATTTTTTAAALAQLIRARLPPPASRARLRLIRAGAVLAPLAPVRLPRAAVNGSATGGAAAAAAAAAAAGPEFILCAVGEALSPAELSAEARRAALPARLPRDDEDDDDDEYEEEEVEGQQVGGAGAPAPLGFDALLAQGVPRDEVERMRDALAARAAYSSAPRGGRPQPSSSAVARAREERWLAAPGRPATLLVGGDDDDDGGEWDWDGGAGLEDAAAAAGRSLDDAVAGALAGFLFPPAAWAGARDDGDGDAAWSRRRQVAALAGLLANVLFAAFRAMSARWEGT
jgi:hypothetical protein